MSWGERSCYWYDKFDDEDRICCPSFGTCNKNCEHYCTNKPQSIKEKVMERSNEVKKIFEEGVGEVKDDVVEVFEIKDYNDKISTEEFFAWKQREEKDHIRREQGFVPKHRPSKKIDKDKRKAKKNMAKKSKRKNRR